MNCCEALDALSFKWSSWDEASGPRQQPETIEQILRLTQPPYLTLSGWDLKYTWYELL